MMTVGEYRPDLKLAHILYIIAFHLLLTLQATHLGCFVAIKNTCQRLTSHSELRATIAINWGDSEVFSVYE
jgi:hypothetical protein